MSLRRSSILIYVGILCSSIIYADDKSGFELSTNYYGKYIWRGQNLNDDPVFQPSLSVSYGNLTAEVWGSLETTNINGNSGDFSEVDYSFDYSAAFESIERLGYSLGAIYYDFPGTATEGTTELYFGLNIDVPLRPSIKIYHDVDEAEGSYIQFGLSRSIENIIKGVGMDISAAMGWGSGSYNKYYWGTDKNELQDLTLSVALPFEISGWTLSPSVNYVTLLSSEIRSTDYYSNDSDYLFAGISLSKRF